MKVRDALAICSLFLTFTAPVAAQQEDFVGNGLFGDIRLGGAVLFARPSGLDVLNDNERLRNLRDEGRRQTEGIPLISGEFGYGFANSGTRLSAGAGIEGPVHLSLRQEAGGWGMLTLSALYQEEEVWEDPYRIGTKRSRTDAESSGFALSWDKVLGTEARIVFEQLSVDVAQDRIGELQRNLRRDGTDRTLSLGYSWELGAAGVVNPSLSHVWIDRDGASNSGCAYEIELAHVVALGRLTFATRLEGSRTEFERTHPIFDKERRETAYGIAETITLDQPFGRANWYLFGIAAHREASSSIDFFDSAGTVFGSGIGYRF